MMRMKTPLDDKIEALEQRVKLLEETLVMLVKKIGEKNGQTD
jgi:uncharacterized Rmd1/YagE family protein